ncbi:MAG: tetratricopeptide repeat protein [Gammaproteobacteria bacterium]
MTRIDFAWNGAFVAMCTVATLADLPALLEFVQARPVWQDALVIHLLTTGACLTYAALYTQRFQGRLHADRAEPGQRVTEFRRRNAARIFWAWYLSFATAVFGPLGSASTAVAFLLYLRHLRSSRPFEEWYKELFPERGRRIYERVYDELMLTVRQRESKSQVIPFADVINYGSREQKQLAISMMSRHFEPPFAPVLKRALEDSDNSVRIQAATAITNLESQFADRVMTLDKRIARDPAPKHLLELARHLDRYAFSGLLDADRTRRVRTRAVETYRRYLDDEPDDLYARVAVGRLLLRAGDVEAARDWLLATRERHGAQPSIDNWLLEAHYRRGDYDAVRVLARELARSAQGRDVMSDGARMWAGLARRSEGVGA